MPIKDLINRRGIIVINLDLLYSDPEKILQFFMWSKFLPLDISTNLMTKEVWYMGLSPRFEVLEEGKVYPKYEITMKTDHHKEKAKKVFELKKID